MDLRSVNREISSGELAFFFDLGIRPRAVAGVAGPPTHRRVVVVGSRIDHEASGIVVRPEIGRLWIGAEGKLKYRHPRKPQPFTERFYVGRDHPEILGHKG